MSPLSSKALRTLWERANRKDLRGSDARTPALKLSVETFPDYHVGLSAADRAAFHADLRAAEDKGAISIDWDRRAGHDGQVVRIRLASLPDLTALLGERTSVEILDEARTALMPLQAVVSTITLFLSAWAEDRAPRGIHVSDWIKVRDAAVAIKDCKSRDFAEVSVRRASVTLFGYSKRIEALIPALDALTAQRIDAEARPAETVLAALGLVKHPSTLLIAGPGQLLSGESSSTAHNHDIQRPYSGVSPRHVFGYAGTPAWLLTVENLTIFHELAAGNAGPLKGLVIYTGGFPSHAVLRAYLAIANAIGEDARLYHWGDTDLGGFRIAETIACAATSINRRISLWAMGDYQGITDGKLLRDKEIADIENICARNGWAANADAIARRRIAIEQELQPIYLP
ncbi:MAG: hypothetical protein KJ065_28480 [Anaerolineae bacterium]|nr:hypothetical protein [Anaerolineae bacterium]